MKRKKRIVALILTSMLCITQGCGQAVKQPDTSSSTTENKASKTLSGTVTGFSGKTLKIKTNDSTPYSFDVSNANILTDSLLAGDTVILTYKGKLSEQDTGQVKVTSLTSSGKTNTAEKENTFCGVLKNLSQNTITLTDSNGTDFIFNSNGCSLEFANGTREGSWVVLTYIGTLTGTDTNNIKVLRIDDTDTDRIEKEQQSMPLTAVDESVYATADVSIYSSYAPDSECYDILKRDTVIKRTGTYVNGWSRVIYDKKDAYIFGDYLSTSKKNGSKVKKTDGSPVAVPQYNAEGTATEQDNVSGIVSDFSMNTLGLNINGSIVYFNTTDARQQYKNGIQIGNSVRITYAGDLSDMNSVVVSSVQDNNPNTSASNSTYIGAVVDGTMNTVTIQTTDGAEMTFNTSAAQNYMDGIQSGSSIKITADPSSAASNSNIMYAMTINSAEDANDDSTYSGTIIDGTADTLTLQMSDGSQIIFDRSQAKNKTHGLVIGNQVTITIDVSEGGTGYKKAKKIKNMQ